MGAYRYFLLVYFVSVNLFAETSVYAPLRDGTLSPFWSNEATGVDLVREEFSDFKPIAIGMFDSLFLNLKLLPHQRLSPAMGAFEDMAQSRLEILYNVPSKDSINHATIVANIMISSITGTSLSGVLSRYIPLGSDRPMQDPQRTEAKEALGSLNQLLNSELFKLLNGPERVINFSLILPDLDKKWYFSQFGGILYAASIRNFLVALRDGAVPADLEKIDVLTGQPEKIKTEPQTLGDIFGYNYSTEGVSPRILVFGIGNQSENIFKRLAVSAKETLSRSLTNSHLRDIGLLVGSMGVDGKVNTYSREGVSVDILAPVDKDLATIFVSKPGQLQTTAYTSSAAPFVSGHEADIVSIVGPLKLNEARILLRKTAIKSVDGGYLLNAYRQIRVAFNLKKKNFESLLPEERRKLLEDPETYNFSEEASRLWNESQHVVVRNSNLGLKLARKSYLLDPTSEKAAWIAAFYQRVNLTLNSLFYENFSQALASN